MNCRKWMMGLVAAAAAVTSSAFAQVDARPVALIEDVQGSVRGASLFDYAYEGDRIDLSGDGVVVLSFFSSCAVQTIEGGVAVVQAARANVTGGLVSTEERPCKGEDLVVAGAGEAAASVKRFSALTVDFTEQAIVSLEPIFKWETDRPARVTITYLDAPEPYVIWSGQVSGNVMAWPAAAPDIEIGKPYLVQAELAGGGTVSAVFSSDPGLPFPDVGANRLVALDPPAEDDDAG